MAESAQYSPAQLAEIKEAFIATLDVVCPACGCRMTARPIGGGSFGLGYSRKREWLICSGCHRSAIFDVKRGTRN
ncbi:MAG: hypothetical protein M3R65_01485 [Gemmatimonadota bacterium]|nr:hypothetical protein [Gemmatimonadota bacterium]